MDFGFQLLKLAGSLALVVALLLLCLYGLKRWGRVMTRKPAAQGLLEVAARHSFGPKHHLMLMKVQQQFVLIGVSPQGMHFLTTLPGLEPAPCDAGATTQSSAGS
jgi:flagellar biosynthetic protein FliO